MSDDRSPVALAIIVATAAVVGAFIGSDDAQSSPGSTSVKALVSLPSIPASSPASVTVAPTLPSLETSPTIPLTAPVPVETTRPLPTEATVPPLVGESSRSALDVFATIAVEREHPNGYSRDLFAIWLDLDDDGCDTRAEVLIAESSTPAQVDPVGCTVVAGDWLSAYDGTTFTSPADIDIDHVVPLKEAWDSGAWQWTAEQRIAYGNDSADPRTLSAVSATTNRSKGDNDPSNWLPPDTNDICSYLGDWVAIKSRWHLSMDESEAGRIGKLLTNDCPELRVTS